MSSKIAYISGPMSGLPDFNFPMFNDCAAKLRRDGWHVFNPAENFDGRTDLARNVYMTADFKHLLSVADDPGFETRGVIMLPGWSKSAGARVEIAMALEMGLKMYFWQSDKPHETTAESVKVFLAVASIVPDATGEIRVTDPKTGGQKGSKPAAFDLLPWSALAEVAKLYRYGADKYQQAHNWRLGYKWSLSFAAMMRHAAAFWEGEDIDPESKCPHLTSVVFHALAMITYGKENLGTDDRPGKTLEALRTVSQQKPV